MVNSITEGGITYNKVSGETPTWRLMYKIGNPKAILIYSAGITSTINTVEEFSTEELGLARIAELGLKKSK